MKNLAISALAAAAVLVVPRVSHADDAAARTQAIQLCRAEVSAQAGEGAEVRLDQLRVRPRAIRVDLDVWRDGQLQNVRCEVERSRGELNIASITPPLQTASAALTAAQ